MKKYFATALTLLGAVALMLAGMYVYSQPDSGGDETLVTKNIIVGSVEIESRGGDSFYVLRDKFGSEYIFNRLPERMRSESYEGRNAQVRCTPADSSGRRLLRELSIDGKVLISSGTGGSVPGACTCYGRGDNHGGLPPAVALRSPRDTHSLRKEQKERRVITRLYHLLRCRHYSTTPITHGLLTAIRGLFFTYSTR